MRAQRSRPAAWLAIVFVLATTGCAASQLGHLQSTYEEQQQARAEARSAGRDATPAETALAATAREAQGRARAETADPKTAVAFYLVAAEAAWQAGPSGQAEIVSIHDEGVATCERLPQQDASAPRDCTLIRLSLPYAVHDLVRAQLDGIDRRVDALPPGTALPASERSRVEQAFADLETQLVKVNDIRGKAATLPGSPELVARIDAQRGQMFCSVVVAFRDLRAVQGSTLSSLKPFTARKEALRQTLEASQVDTSCGQAAPAPGPG